MIKKAIFIFTALLLLAKGIASAQGHAETRILFVFDCSNSMWAKWDKSTRIAAAKDILIKLVDSLKDNKDVEMGLRCYGHQSPVAEKNCKDTKLEVAFARNNAQNIISFIKNVNPNGYTPIAYSLTQAAQDFPDKNGRNIILLITDGLEECGGDPCSVSGQMQQRNVILKPYIVGIGLNDQQIKAFDCVGRIYNPNNEKELQKAFDGVVSEALGMTTIQVNLLDTRGQATQTDAEMTFYNEKNNRIEYNFYHTMNRQRKPDTFNMDPFITYDLQLNTTPPVHKKGIVLEAGKHNIVDLNAPRGSLEITCQSAKDYTNLRCLVRLAGRNEIIHVQPLNTLHEYLTGAYDIEILTLPRIEIKGVTVSQDKTQRTVIPEPGRLEVSFPKDVVASIYIFRNNKQEWVTDINGTSSMRKELYLLQPGQYSVVYRPYNTNNSIDTREKQIEVKIGGYHSLKLDY